MAANPNFEVLCKLATPTAAIYSKQQNRLPLEQWDHHHYLWWLTYSCLIDLGRALGQSGGRVGRPQGGLQHWWRNRMIPQGFGTLGPNLIKRPVLVISTLRLASFRPSLMAKLKLATSNCWCPILLATSCTSPGTTTLRISHGLSGKILDSVAPPKPLRSFRVTMALPLGPAARRRPGNLECIVITAAYDLVHWYLDAATGS